MTAVLTVFLYVLPHRRDHITFLLNYKNLSISISLEIYSTPLVISFDGRWTLADYLSALRCWLSAVYLTEFPAIKRVIRDISLCQATLLQIVYHQLCYEYVDTTYSLVVTNELGLYHILNNCYHY